MIKVYSYIGKNIEELKKQALEELNCQESDLISSKEDMPTKLLLGKKYQLKIVKKSDIINHIKEFFKEFSNKTNIELNVEIREENDSFKVLLISSDKNISSIMIGKEGKNLNALSKLLKKSITIQIKMPLHLYIDYEDYKKVKEVKFKNEIKKIAEDVNQNGVEVKLDAMNSYNRRIVHVIVSNYPSLKAESYGEEPDRYVVIGKKED
ncbi:MAG: hypothetical protein PHE54_00605 [Bacilli bacterium]|nr:hypothetical protein [Bacilli bacterium]